MKKNLNFVYILSDKMREVERQFAQFIAKNLPDWQFTRSVRKPRPDCINFSFFVKNTRADFFMSHGLADKNYLFRRGKDGNPTIGKFKRILVPGPWLKDRVRQEFGEEIAQRCRVVGWPRADLLVAASKPAAAGDLAEPQPRRRVLWAPTLSGDTKTSSFPAFEAFLPALKERFEVDVSLHPRDRRGGAPTFDLLLAADVVISDHGTMVYEAWALGKPVVFPDWIVRDETIKEFPGSAEAHIFANRIGIHTTSIAELIEKVAEAQGVGADVEAFMKLYLPPETVGRSAALIAEEIEQFRTLGGP